MYRNKKIKGSELLFRMSEVNLIGQIYFNEYMGYISVGLQNLGNYALPVLIDENGNILANKTGEEVAFILDLWWARRKDLELELTPVGIKDMMELNKSFRQRKYKP